MKKLFILSIIIPFIFSCINTSINGKLDGMWQLISIEKNGELGVDTKEDRIFYNIKLHLIHLQQANGYDYLGRFIQTEDSLFVSDFLQKDDNSILATSKDLASFGIFNTSERFGIEKMTKKEMILKSKSTVLIFRKF